MYIPTVAMYLTIGCLLGYLYTYNVAIALPKFMQYICMSLCNSSYMGRKEMRMHTSNHHCTILHTTCPPRLPLCAMIPSLVLYTQHSNHFSSYLSFHQNPSSPPPTLNGSLEGGEEYSECSIDEAIEESSGTLSPTSPTPLQNDGHSSYINNLQHIPTPSFTCSVAYVQ